ncbi:MAG: hypothetical protein OIF38_09670, partial [Cellvibrionaceae bacterium]|nr:hypothetical protein [Cellvibrionaceae bacterium]
AWDICDGSGEVLAGVALHNSFEPYFAEHLPWPLVSVKLQAGPIVYAHGAEADLPAGTAVTIENRQDSSGAGVFWAQPLNRAGD